MPDNDREVFEKLTDGNDASALKLLTYSLFAFERQEWVRHYKERQNAWPSEVQINEWIANKTDYDFDQMRTRAANYFDVAARAYLADDFEAVRQEILQDVVVREVKAAGNFWRQLFIALVTAILAPIIIGVIIVAALRSEDVIPTITGTKSKAEPKIEAPAKPPG